MGTSRDNRIVVDGRERIAKAYAERICRDVEARHAQELAEAGWLRRTLIRWHIRAEVRRELKRELERIAPRDGLYSKRG